MDDLTAGDGIADFIYDGSSPATVAADLYNDGGLEFAGASNELAVEVADFAGAGLAGINRDLYVGFVLSNTATIKRSGDRR